MPLPFPFWMFPKKFSMPWLCLVGDGMSMDLRQKWMKGVYEEGEYFSSFGGFREERGSCGRMEGGKGP